MAKRSLAILMIATMFFGRIGAAEDVILPIHDLGNQGLEVAQLIIHLSKSIVRDLNPPVTGAERTVTSAVVSDEGSMRSYYIEGEDVYHNGRVISNYWIRLSMPLTEASAPWAVRMEVGDGEAPMAGKPLEQETVNLIGPLLNSLYDIANLKLDHSRVILDRITEASQESSLVYELYGLNDVCEHVDLNSFKLVITRQLLRNRPAYETELTLPYRLPVMQ